MKTPLPYFSHDRRSAAARIESPAAGTGLPAGGPAIGFALRCPGPRSVGPSDRSPLPQSDHTGIVDQEERIQAPDTSRENFRLSLLDGVPWLMAMVLYGSGLRLMECLRLRVKDIDFTIACNSHRTPSRDRAEPCRSRPHGLRATEAYQTVCRGARREYGLEMHGYPRS